MATSCALLLSTPSSAYDEGVINYNNHYLYNVCITVLL